MFVFDAVPLVINVSFKLLQFKKKLKFCHSFLISCLSAYRFKDPTWLKHLI